MDFEDFPTKAEGPSDDNPFHPDSAVPPDASTSSDSDKEATGSVQNNSLPLHNAPLTLTWKNVSVIVDAAGTILGDDILSAANPRQIVDLAGIRKRPEKAILNDVTGQLQPNEMMLVLGRPGSGCSTMLQVLANKTAPFKKVVGEVNYGSMTSKEALRYRQEILYNSEEDAHFPTMNVDATLQFALRNKTPKERPVEYSKPKMFVSTIRESILSRLGISHTGNTLVGNEFVRGVSGGERKRVSIAEVMAGQSSIQCWDNSTRGLDASTALDFAKALRADADLHHKTIVVTLYQAGNDIYDLFDKVVVLCEGREIFYGPRAWAKDYFEEMGFQCPAGANVADFLTSVTVTTERTIRDGFEGRVPTTAEEFQDRFRASQIYRRTIGAIEAPESMTDQTNAFKETVERKIKGKSAYTVHLKDQIVACITRRLQILWGDKRTLMLKSASTLIQALVTGSLFYNLSSSSTSIFTRPGALFFPILFFCMESMSETTSAFQGRPILARQKDFAFCRPTAYCIANVLIDIPIAIFQSSLFSIVYYWMCAFQADAGKFFTFWIIVIITILCYGSMFRMCGALFKNFGGASMVSGFLTMVHMIYSGYLIPFKKMHVWFRWIFWINPAAYAFESLMGNEFGGRQMSCEAPQYIPYGTEYTNAQYRGCTIPGSTGNVVDGESYIRDQYSYSTHHIWRGFGVVVGFWLLFAAVTAIGYERLESSGTSSYLLFKRGSKDSLKKLVDEENSTEKSPAPSPRDSGPPADVAKGLSRQSTFTWKDLDYYVHVGSEKRQLLNKVSGFVKPGQLVALMGTSGAGKTTLLDVLAQRKDSGIIEGSILVDGRPQSISFQRTTGYCEQLDVHEPTTTVKEALIFSARLRQPQAVPEQEKLDYVDHVIELLELHDIENALIGTPGFGLAVEQRKRLTLGVELAARPSLLLLDEPSSGLDGQSAYNVVRFMRKLADNGQSVLCTIHQPSASLFNFFDSLLLLAKGGKTTYFGETGEVSAKILEYFARYGAPAPPNANPAEHIIDVVQGRSAKGTDWTQLWLESPEHEEMMRQLHDLNERALNVELPQDSNDSEYAVSIPYQCRIVVIRQIIALWRSPDYVWNKIILHVYAALFGGFTFWMVGDGSFDLQLRLFAIFNFIFVAPGVINQMQPFFLRHRDIFEAREKKSKTYHWIAFITAEVISELPYLIICGTLYFVCWYFTVGFPVAASVSGQVYFQMLLYELLYTAIGQSIAAYAPNEYFAALANPLIIGAGLIGFCGVVVPYNQINVFWRYWLYWMDPFNYLVGGLLTQVEWDVKVHCSPSELTRFAIPDATTCGEYMNAFISANSGYVVNPNDTTSCSYCPYKTGAEYLRTFNFNAKYYAWRDTGITALFCLSSYAAVFLMMKMRSKKTLSAKSD